jgi:hypothetical protein
MVNTRTIYAKHEEFTFPAMYKGNNMDLTIVPVEDRFAVLANGKLFGHIKVGYGRHTWFVTDSKFVDSELVNEIGQRIIGEFY